jgi:hypothetical protein
VDELGENRIEGTTHERRLWDRQSGNRTSVLQAPDGSQRLLVEGDRVLEGEQVETGASGAITLSLADGKQLDLWP